MKLNQNQKARVSKLTYENVKYCETYYEVLDHVISALESDNDESINFHEKLNRIWDKDFGGYENLPVLEKEREKEVNKRIVRRHWNYFIDYFKFPLVIGTTTFIIAVYFLANFISRNILISSLFLTAFLPFLLYVFSYFRLKKFNLIKPSIKDKKFNSFGCQTYGVLNLVMFLPAAFTDNEPSQVLRTATYLPVVILLIIVFSIYSLSYFRLYKETFKMELSK
nr:hypothetical protein [Pseudopedobacter sp.]